MIEEVLIVGPYPPPIGGISVHVQRLKRQLSQNRYHVTVMDYSNAAKKEHSGLIVLPRNQFKKILACASIARQAGRNSIVHFHVSAFGRFKWAMLPLLLLFRRQRKLITIHSGRLITESIRTIDRIHLKSVLRHFDAIVAVSVEQADYLTRVGVPREKIKVIPAFIPDEPDARLLPPSIARIAKEKIIVLTSGYLTELYNYDILIDCIRELNDQRFTFVFAFYHETDRDYERRIYQRLSELGNVVILRNQPPEVFVAVMGRCQIYVRATKTDGDAVAIREALHLRKTVFASDCVQRPDRCQLFSTFDGASLLRLFQQWNGQSNDSANLNSPTNTDRIMMLYQELANSNRESATPSSAPDQKM